jgi:two-component system sensor histidine kinase DevS
MTGPGDRKDILLQAGLALSSELSLPTVLLRIVDLARQVTEARYGALGILGPDRRIEQFIAVGMDEETRQAIGHYPTGGGILGALIEDATPLRLTDISRDPRSVGFPKNHPPMTSFLGAPVKALGRVYGNIYLTEKQGAPEFTTEDEEDLLMLATQAGVAVANAHLYEESRRRERWLDAVRELVGTVLEATETTDILHLAASRVRELVHADMASIAVPSGDGGSLVIEAADGAHAADLVGTAFSLDGSVSGEVIRTRAPVVLSDASIDERVRQPIFRAGDFGPAVFVPLVARGLAFGTLCVANALGGHAFGDEEIRLIASFADQASVALEYARTQTELKRLVVMDDRERIAKELHDGVIQSLFAVGMGLQGTAMLTEDEQLTGRIEGAVTELDRVIRDLRNYIFGLRPGILADRQLGQALHDLAEDVGEKSGVTIVVDVDERVAADLASSAADVVQFAREALSNVCRHAGAATCRVSLRHLGEAVVLEIDDDGRGFDPASARGTGNGLTNLEDRAAALGGKLSIDSTPGEGTVVRVIIPL